MNLPNLKLLFKKITDHYPYNYQEDVSQYLLNDTNIILQAPTGSGKTWASLMPFLYVWKEWKKDELQNAEDFPRKLIYSLPLRTLANSLYETVSKNDYITKDLGINVTLQTGEHSKDELFEGDIIFTTIDQTLSNILGIPLSLPKKLANINAGAVLSSYLIFDEFHLLDPQRSLDTVITLLKKMKSITPFCLMTATLSTSFLKNIENYLEAKIVTVTKEDHSQFAFVKEGAKKFVKVVDNCLTAENIVRNHTDKSIVICNTVERCKTLFRQLKKKTKKNTKLRNTKLICIHSQFFQRDRKAKEEEIIKYFGKDSIYENAILVSTQVIEVGIDISCDTMHVEISPVNSFLQRIGRCARWEGNGQIFVYDIPEDENKFKSYMPYIKELCKNTFKELQRYENTNLDYFISQKIINKVLSGVEKAIYKNIETGTTFEKIREAWILGGKEKARELIRDIRSINVVLLKRQITTDYLYKYETISINPHSLIKRLKSIEDKFESEIPHLAFSLEEDIFLDYTESKILEPLDIDKLYLKNIIALNPEYIGYSKKWGLDFEGNLGVVSKLVKEKPHFQYAIKMDTYSQHIHWMMRIYERELYDQVLYSINKIKQKLNWDFEFDQLMKYIIVMHDYGKLDHVWQGISNDYQSLKFKRLGKKWENQFLTHTDYDPNNSPEDKTDIELVRRKWNVRKNPDHAGVGAKISQYLLPVLLKMERTKANEHLRQIVITTIIRHHAAFAKNSPAYKIVDGGAEFVNEQLLKSLVRDLYISNPNQYDFLYHWRKENLEQYLVSFNNPYIAFLYFIFIRVLRLCDQRSFEEHPENK